MEAGHRQKNTVMDKLQKLTTEIVNDNRDKTFVFEDLTDIKKKGKKKNKSNNDNKKYKNNNKDSKAINEKIIIRIIKTKGSGQISTDGHTDCSRNLLIINPKIEHYT